MKKNEKYLSKKISSIVKYSFPKMTVYPFSRNTLTAFLGNKEYADLYSKRIIQTTTRKICEEFEKIGDVMIDELE